MRDFSSALHRGHTARHHPGRVIDDPVLPAATHLSGPHAADVLAAAIDATGATLLDCRTVNVQYRPETDLVVRYVATVRRPDGSVATETLLAGATREGAHPGTLPVECETDAGESIVAGVWRWPFDPILLDLERLVTPAHAAEVLAGVAVGPLSIEVVVYRPCERVVARAVDRLGQELYLKVVAPAAVPALLARHGALAAAGLPCPEVVASGPSWIAMSALRGPTLRELMKRPGVERRDAAAWPVGRHFVELCDRIAGVDLGHMPPVRRRLVDASLHAAMLAGVFGAERGRLADLSARFDAEASATVDRCGVVVHGDLHEGQLVVHDGEVTGVLDVDDAGPGDPLDDRATLLGHLRFRAITSASRGTEIDAYQREVRRALVPTAHDADGAQALDIATAAVLMGLATGPFRIQQPDWQSAVSRVLDEAEQLVGR
jgi:Phosphotransferase enzyme family